MTDEAAAMLRVGAFGLACAVVYGLLTKEYLGTLELLTLGLGPGFAGLVMYSEARRHGIEREPLGALAWRFAGFPRPDPQGRHELAADDLAVLPTPSMWPFVSSIGIAITLTGLIFGAWLVVLGAGFLAFGVWGWIAAVSRETLAARRRESAAR